MITLLLTLDQIIGIFTMVECLVEISLLVKGGRCIFPGTIYTPLFEAIAQTLQYLLKH